MAYEFTYEYWGDPETGTVTLICADFNSDHFLRSGAIEPGMVHLYSVRSGTFQEARAIQHKNNGWEPYVPVQ